IQSDLRHYAPLVRPGGILCGHDCEGRVSDYDRDFLEVGKQTDFHEGVHCGVVLAVGAAFPDCAIDHGIWSVRAAGPGHWRPTALELPGIPRRRQPPPPPLGFSPSYQVVRYGRRVYGLPFAGPDVDVTADDEGVRDRLPSAPSVAELEKVLGEKV